MKETPMAEKIKLSTLLSKHPQMSTMKVLKILSKQGFHAASPRNAEITLEQAELLERILRNFPTSIIKEKKKKAQSSALQTRIPQTTITHKPKKRTTKAQICASPSKKEKKKKSKQDKNFELGDNMSQYTTTMINEYFIHNKSHTVAKIPKGAIKSKNDKNTYDEYIKKALIGVTLPLSSFDAIKQAVKRAEDMVRLNSVLLFNIYHHLDNNTILQKFFVDNVLDHYIRTNILTKRAEKTSVHDRKLLDIYNETHDKESTFDVIRPQNFILNWNDVTFHNKYIRINPPRLGNIKFAPLDVPNKMSNAALNAIREFLQTRLPQIHCVAKENKLIVIDKIDLSIAIRYLKVKSTKPALNPEADGVKKKVTAHIFTVNSFEDALLQADKFNKAELSKLKSKYINYLAFLQSERYKIIPCYERILHESNITNKMEHSFIFTLSANTSNNIILAVENLNIDRATMLFSFRRCYYERALHGIFDYLQSSEPNKRSTLRRWENYGLSDINIEYHAVNHRNTEQFSWYEVMKYRIRTM